MTDRQKYQESLSEFIARFPWTHFVTLTWDPKRPGGNPTVNSVVERSKKAMCALAKMVAGRGWYLLKPSPIDYIGVVERTAFGRLHVHLAVRLSPKLVPTSRRKFIGLWRRWAGNCTVRKVDDVRGLSDYLTKASGPNEEFFVSPK